MKDLKNLEGAKMLSKMEQKAIKGGYEECRIHPDTGLLCHIGFCCDGGVGDACLPCIEQ